MNEHVAAMEADLGDGHVIEWRVANELARSPAASQLRVTLATSGIPFGEGEAHGGTDIVGLRAFGVPVIDLRQDATRYFDVHHTANDTLDQVHPDELLSACGTFAVTTYQLARSDETLGRFVVRSEH
jgi:hypothetical protein